jgi:hypothetical protein
VVDIGCVVSIGCVVVEVGCVIVDVYGTVVVLVVAATVVVVDSAVVVKTLGGGSGKTSSIQEPLTHSKSDAFNSDTLSLLTNDWNRLTVLFSVLFGTV